MKAMKPSKSWITLLALCSMSIGAQSIAPKEASSNSHTKLFRLRYAEPGRVEMLLSHTGYTIRADDQMHVVLVQGPPEWVVSATQLIQELDQPGSSNGPADIDVTMYVIAASNKSESTKRVMTPLESVIRQLKAVFPYTAYEILSTTQVRSRDGEDVTTEGVMRSTVESQGRPHGYKLRYRASYSGASSAGSNAIALNAFGFEAFLDEGRKASLYTNIDVREGQKVVVGKTNIDDGSAGLFLVVTATSVEREANK